MKPKTSDISTVVIINKNQQHTKSLQIKTKHLNRLKHYAWSIAAVVAALGGLVFYLHRENAAQEAENQQLQAQITKLKGTMPVVKAEVNTQGTAQSYIQSIEVKLKTINEYLKRRGLKGFTVKGTGGDGNREGVKLPDTEAYSLYDDYLKHLTSTIAFTPMGYPRISSFTSFFGYRSDPFDSEHAEFHPGIDFKGNRGDAVKCTASGKVVFAGWAGGYGKCVRIQHINNLETLYGHLSKIEVKVGQEVTVGDNIGKVGSTGHSTGAHLHYEVRKNGKPINPVNFLTLNK
ncbi:peptidoglycan DD-metalloendopeptidase family protein [Mucilaginibacter sp. cycad4]|uniref:peptidoglycan DD-metalloendopeptidase family protein n=1 Tax=Mucilaginibacter sp. cycad4 TaxID=3342096 RepID=UPI002AAB4CCB|nr:peptidoglycan DD-metalloendopeptidase family protein [Mucilaginibacter gossypii]WPU97987.1 peptidoglycan DD-metalloendopeptidase family protein [Mucilaginibacter gossypii]